MHRAAAADEERATRIAALRRALGRTMARLARRADAVRGDLARAEKAEDKARVAQLFVVEAARAPRGATRLVAVDWSSGEAREVEIPLDPAQPARAQLDATFAEARRMKEGARVAAKRLAHTEATRAALAALGVELDAALEGEERAEGETEASARASPVDLGVFEARARALAPKDFRLGPAAAPGRKKHDAPLPPYRVFLSSSGARVLVGKGAEKNDALTFHISRPRDLWLHAKGWTGAHVIVPLRKDATCPGDVLVDAAHLAAHFSDARGEDLVEVQYVARRYLRKPRGSPPGLVVVDREKVLVLRVDRERLATLLEREQAGD